MFFYLQAKVQLWPMVIQDICISHSENPEKFSD